MFTLLGLKHQIAKSIAPPDSPIAKLYKREAFEYQVKTWEKEIEPGSGERKDIAAKLIMTRPGQILFPILDLSRLQLKTLPDLSALDHVTKLFLDDNCLTSLPKLNKLPPDIRIISAKNNQLTEVSSELLERFYHISASSNKIKSLPPFHDNFNTRTSHCFDSIDVSSNKIESLPSLPTNIAMLDVSQNNLSNLPENIFDLSSSCRVYIGGNNFPKDCRDKLNHAIAASNYEGPQFYSSKEEEYKNAQIKAKDFFKNFLVSKKS